MSDTQTCKNGYYIIDMKERNRKVKLKIAMGSDIHNGEWPELKENVDVLIFAGDFTGSAANDFLSQVSEFERLMNELKDLSKGKAKQVFVVFGNHDTFAVYNPRHQMILKWEGIFNREGIKMNFLTNETFKYKGVRFYGNPYNRPAIPKGSVWGFHWNPSYEERTRNYLSIAKPDVMITHAPPKDILDLTRSGEHAGEERWFQYLKDHRPKLWVFGHIHEARGVLDFKDTTYVNASITGLWGDYIDVERGWVIMEKEFMVE